MPDWKRRPTWGSRLRPG